VGVGLGLVGVTDGDVAVGLTDGDAAGTCPAHSIGYEPAGHAGAAVTDTLVILPWYTHP
jgi:hypothetical protein